MSRFSSAVADPGPVRVADQIYERLRSGILAHEFAPGARLSVPRLAAQFEASRSPVREAVQRLVQDGLAIEAPHKGCVVATITLDDVIPLYELREVLEGLAARLAAQRATRRDLTLLHAELRSHKDAVDRGDIGGHLKHDMAFHSLLRQAAGNPELHAALEHVQGKVTIAMLSADHTSWPVRAVAEHGAILDALVGADPDAAEAAARAHIERIRGDLAAQKGNP